VHGDIDTKVLKPIAADLTLGSEEKLQKFNLLESQLSELHEVLGNFHNLPKVFEQVSAQVEFHNLGTYYGYLQMLAWIVLCFVDSHTVH
jgi:hypothetical protein